MYRTLREFIFAGRKWPRGVVFDAVDSIAPSRLKMLEQTRFIVREAAETKKPVRTRKKKEAKE